MSNQELEKLADILQKSDEYRVARKYQKPTGYTITITLIAKAMIN